MKIEDFKRKDFISLLDLDEEEINRVPLRNFVDTIFLTAKKILEPPEFSKYPDHGLDHSYRVIEYALKVSKELIPPENRLSRLEKMTLGCAALVHDIGMQWTKFYPRENKNYVRKNHCYFGNRLFELICSNEEEDEEERKGINLPNLGIPEDLLILNGGIIHRISLVAFLHHPEEDIDSPNLRWDILNNPEYNADYYFPGNIPYRTKLLSALLRFGDELDMDYRRLNGDIGRIESKFLKPDNKLHWISCLYTQKITINHLESNNLEILLSWAAVDNDKQISLVRKILHEIREYHFNEEVKHIAPYLIWSENTPPPTLKFRLSDQPERFSKKLLGRFSIPPKLEDHLNKSLKKTLEEFEKNKPANLIQLKENRFSKKAKQIADRFLQSEEGIIHKHYALKTQWHTDKYIKCRELVAEPEFTESLVKGLAEHFKKCKFTRIVAQGTSAIRIGSILSATLGTKFSYANGNIKFQSEVLNSEDFKEYERIATISPSDKILILDDIIGIGNVFSDSINQLIKMNLPCENITFFYIYSVGYEKKVIRKFRDVKVYYLTAYTNVAYWKENKKGRCKICKNDESEPERE